MATRGRSRTSTGAAVAKRSHGGCWPGCKVGGAAATDAELAGAAAWVAGGGKDGCAGAVETFDDGGCPGAAVGAVGGPAAGDTDGRLDGGFAAGGVGGRLMATALDAEDAGGDEATGAFTVAGGAVSQSATRAIAAADTTSAASVAQKR